jgi:hypothetical protein
MAAKHYPHVMHPTVVAGPDFAQVLDSGEAFEELAGSDGHLVLVDGDDLPDALGSDATGRLVTLPAVIVAVIRNPDRRPDWADLVLAADDPRLVAVRSAVRANPQAATVLAVLLRSGGARSIPEGLLAESTAYGLLQGGPEFARWRSGRSVRHRATGDGPAVLVRRRDDELWVTLNRPRVLNALDSAMRDELETALHVAVMDPSITSVHLDGAGPSFCSGGDLQEFGTRSDPPSAHLVRLLRNPARTIAELADRTVAHLHGDVVGSGVELAAFAHRVVAARSTRLSLPEVRLGLIPGAGGTVSLPRRIGRHRTLLLALAVQSVDAATALDWGLVDEVSG